MSSHNHKDEERSNPFSVLTEKAAGVGTFLRSGPLGSSSATDNDSEEKISTGNRSNDNNDNNSSGSHERTPLLPNLVKPLGERLKKVGESITRRSNSNSNSNEHNNDPQAGAPRALPPPGAAGATNSRSGNSHPPSQSQAEQKQATTTPTVVQLSHWSTILASDVTLTLGLAVILTTALAALGLPSVPPLMAVGFLVCFAMGYGTGRWQVQSAILLEKHQQLQAQLDHRKALRPATEETALVANHRNYRPFGSSKWGNAFRQHTILKQVLGSKRLLRRHPDPLRKVWRQAKVWTGRTNHVDDPAATPSERLARMEEGTLDESSTVISATALQPSAEQPRQFGRIQLAPPTTQQSKLPSHWLTASPLCPALQGMDIFATDAPVERIGGHSAFIAAGLRDQPVFIINAVTHVGNVVIYLELPAGIDHEHGSLSRIPEEDKDEGDDNLPDSAALLAKLQSFLHAPEERRNARLQMAASLNQGPLVVQTLAPGDATVFGVVGAVNPGTWHYYPATPGDGNQGSGEENNRTLHAAWELQIDLSGSKFMRTGISIAKRHLHSLVLDVCLLIKPEESEMEGASTEKPQSAVLGCFRLDHVDMQHAPDFPIPPTPEEDLQMMRRASKILSDIPSLGIDEDFLEQQGTEVVLGVEAAV